MFSVSISEKGGSSRTMEFDKPEVTIGRVQGNDIILPKGNISKRHSRIVLKDDKFIIVDLKSTNGTYVNGRKITSPHILKDNDKVYIGDFVLTIDAEGPGAAEAPPPPPPPPSRPAKGSGKRRPKPEPKDADFGEYLDPDEGFDAGGADFDKDFGADDLLGGDFDPEPEPDYDPPSTAPPAPPRVAVKKSGKKRKSAPRSRSVDRPASAKRGPSPTSQAQAALFEVLSRTPRWEQLAFDPDGVDEAVRRALGEVERGFGAKVDSEDVVARVTSELCGYGPLDDLLGDSEVAQIWANAPHQIFVERAGEIQAHGVTFSSALSMSFVIRKLCMGARSNIDDNAVVIDTRLEDGTQMTALMPPVGAQGPVLTLRKAVQPTVTLDKLVSADVLSESMAEFLRTCVAHRKNIVISCNHAADGSAMTRAIACQIDSSERIVTLEEVARLNLPQANVASLEAAPSAPHGGVSLRELMRMALRLAPDRLVVGDCRGPEALEAVQIMGGAVDGSLLQVHGHGARDALGRLEAMMQAGSSDLSSRAIRELIATSIEVVVQMTRFASGSPRVTEISVVTGMEIDLVTTQDVFAFHSEGADSNGEPIGQFNASGVVPRFYEDLQRQGAQVDMSIFRD